MLETLGFIPSTLHPKKETSRSEVQDHPYLQREFKVSQNNKRFCLKATEDRVAVDPMKQANNKSAECQAEHFIQITRKEKKIFTEGHPRCTKD